MGDDWGMSDEVDVFAIALEIAQLVYSKCSTAEDVTKVLEEAKNILQLSYSGIALSGVACYSVL